MKLSDCLRYKNYRIIRNELIKNITYVKAIKYTHVLALDYGLENGHHDLCCFIGGDIETIDRKSKLNCALRELREECGLYGYKKDVKQISENVFLINIKYLSCHSE